MREVRPKRHHVPFGLQIEYRDVEVCPDMCAWRNRVGIARQLRRRQPRRQRDPGAEVLGAGAARMRERQRAGQPE